MAHCRKGGCSHFPSRGLRASSPALLVRNRCERAASPCQRLVWRVGAGGRRVRKEPRRTPTACWCCSPAGEVSGRMGLEGWRGGQHSGHCKPRARARATAGGGRWGRWGAAPRPLKLTPGRKGVVEENPTEKWVARRPAWWRAPPWPPRAGSAGSPLATEATAKTAMTGRGVQAETRPLRPRNHVSRHLSCCREPPFPSSARKGSG